MIRPPPISTLFPYTTLFRSRSHGRRDPRRVRGGRVKGVAILNPRAGLAAARARAALERSAHWRGMEVRLTTAPGDARRFAAEAAAAGAEIVLAIGGDGTANETAWGLLGTPVALGLVPMGSGNGLARTLGVPLKPDAALAV